MCLCPFLFCIILDLSLLLFLKRFWRNNKSSITHVWGVDGRRSSPTWLSQAFLHFPRSFMKNLASCYYPTYPASVWWTVWLALKIRSGNPFLWLHYPAITNFNKHENPSVLSIHCISIYQSALKDTVVSMSHRDDEPCVHSVPRCWRTSQPRVVCTKSPTTTCTHGGSRTSFCYATASKSKGETLKSRT